MSWLADRTGIHIGRKKLGSLLGGALGIPFGPMGMALGSGLGRTVGGVTSGEKFGPALMHGATSGALGYGAGKLLPKIPGFGRGGGAAGGAAGGGGAAGNLFQDNVITPMASRLGAGGFSPGSFIKQNAGSLINAGGGAFSAVSGAQQEAANRELMEKQFEFQKQQALRENSMEDEDLLRKRGVGQQWLTGLAQGPNDNPYIAQILRAMGYA